MQGSSMVNERTENSSFQGYRWNQEWQLESIRIDILVTHLCQTWEIPIICSVLYLVMVFGGKRYMTNKTSFSLRTPMMMWSLLLAIFSILGTMRTYYAMFDVMRKGGIKAVVCDASYYSSPVIHFWAAVFPLSKLVEYIDTAFIVLRKQNLIFLHWYHHVTVALFCWLMYGGKYAGGWLFMTLNYGVHSLMYSYYTLRAAKIKLPRTVALFITISQILQMVIGCGVMAALVTWSNKDACPTSVAQQISGSLMYASYLVLFVHFFYNAYICGSKKVISPAHVKHQEENSSQNEDTSLSNHQNGRGSDYKLRLRKHPKLAK